MPIDYNNKIDAMHSQMQWIFKCNGIFKCNEYLNAMQWEQWMTKIKEADNLKSSLSGRSIYLGSQYLEKKYYLLAKH